MIHTQKSTTGRLLLMASTNWQINTWFQHLTKTTEKYTLRCLIGAWKLYLKAIKIDNSVKLILFKFANIQHEWWRRLLFCKRLDVYPREAVQQFAKDLGANYQGAQFPGGGGSLHRLLTARVHARVRAYAARKQTFWDHFSKSLVTIQVFTSGTWALTKPRLKNGGK